VELIATKEQLNESDVEDGNGKEVRKRKQDKTKHKEGK
jgi:hypothetical protein